MRAVSRIANAEKGGEMMRGWGVERDRGQETDVSFYDVVEGHLSRALEKSTKGENYRKEILKCVLSREDRATVQRPVC